MMERLVTGVDIGGSHISASLIDVEQRRIISGSACRKDVNSGGTVDEILNEWAEVISACTSKVSPNERKIGIAMPGPVDYDTGVCFIKGQNKYESLYGHNLKELLATKLEIAVENILLVNDAAGFLAGEMFIGAGRGYTNVLGLTLGTGFGTARSDNGSVMDADLWHHPFLGDKAEHYLSGPWLIAEAKRASGKTFRNVREMADATTGDPVLEQVFLKFGNNLAQFLTPYVKQWNTELIIVGGNISRASRYFKETMEQQLAKNVETRVKTAEIGEVAALVGAAAMWENKIKNPIAD